MNRGDGGEVEIGRRAVSLPIRGGVKEGSLDRSTLPISGDKRERGTSPFPVRGEFGEGKLVYL